MEAEKECSENVQDVITEAFEWKKNTAFDCQHRFPAPCSARREQAEDGRRGRGGTQTS